MIHKFLKSVIVLSCCTTLYVSAQKATISLEDIYKKRTFRSESVQGFKSMNDDNYYTENVQGNIIKKSFATNETVDTLIKKNQIKDNKGKDIGLGDIEWSADEQKVLLFKDREYIYRRSSKALAFVYNIKNNKTIAIDNEKIMHATFSPDGNKVAFVKNNNLFIKNLLTNKTTTITNDGKWNYIINGNCDWVYEEEFSFTKAFEWSSNSQYLAYYKFDESKVRQFSFTQFDSLYTTEYSYKYPKPGEANSVVNIFIYNTQNSQSVKVNTGNNTDIYIPRIKWMGTTNNLCVYKLNRLQNHLQLLNTNASNGSSTVFYQEKNDAYIDITDDIFFLKNGKQFIISSEKNGYNDLYLCDINSAKEQQLINQKVDIADVYGVDETTGNIYFSLAQETKNRMPYAYNINTQQLKPLSNNIGTNTLNFSKNFTYFVKNFSTATTPAVITLNKTANVLADVNFAGKILKDNSALKQKLANYNLAVPEFFTIKNSKGYELSSWMLKPQNFDANKKYPVLFCNYGGPGSQQVANRFGAINFWHHYLSQQGYIILCVDNTGTGFKGETFKKATYLNLGNLEIADQIEAAQYMSSLPYVDASRIGHFGWSFGGFMSSMAITKGASVFKTAVAVAPVTDWRYYDNIYTERFMRTPQLNPEGYKNTAPLNFVDKIKGNYLIIHGTADDNVHFQHSVMMVDEMIKKNIDFESAYYPNKNHGISGGNTSFHIFSKITKFILTKL